MLKGLDIEGKRWLIEHDELEDQLKNLLGNILLAAALVAYTGPYFYDFRFQLNQNWIGFVNET